MTISFGAMSGSTPTGSRPPPPPPPPQENSEEGRLSPGEDMLSLFDTDDSGDLSVAEIADSHLSELIGDDYDTVDADGDGLLSVEELDAHAQSVMAANGGPPPPPPSEADAASLIEALLEGLEAGDTTTVETTEANSAYVNSIYETIQEMISAAA